MRAAKRWAVWSGNLDIKGDADGFEGRGPLTSEGCAPVLFRLTFVGSYADHVVTAPRTWKSPTSRRAPMRRAGARSAS